MPSAMVEVHRGIYCFRRVWQFLQILNQSCQKLSIYPRCVPKGDEDMSPQMFTTALLITVKKERQATPQQLVSG